MKFSAQIAFTSYSDLLHHTSFFFCCLFFFSNPPSSSLIENVTEATVTRLTRRNQVNSGL